MNLSTARQLLRELESSFGFVPSAESANALNAVEGLTGAQELRDRAKQDLKAAIVDGHGDAARHAQEAYALSYAGYPIENGSISGLGEARTLAEAIAAGIVGDDIVSRGWDTLKSRYDEAGKELAELVAIADPHSTPAQIAKATKKERDAYLATPDVLAELEKAHGLMAKLLGPRYRNRDATHALGLAVEHGTGDMQELPTAWIAAKGGDRFTAAVKAGATLAAPPSLNDFRSWSPPAEPEPERPEPQWSYAGVGGADSLPAGISETLQELATKAAAEAEEHTTDPAAGRLNAEAFERAVMSETHKDHARRVR